MQEDKSLKRIIQKGATIKASPELEDNIMLRIEQLQAAPGAMATPGAVVSVFPSLRVVGLLTAAVILIAFLILGISLKMGNVLYTELQLLLPNFYAPDFHQLILCLAGFWLLLFFNYFLGSKLAHRDN